jgi:photosystem II stability/assembly factor-like uncharacterized protein
MMKRKLVQSFIGVLTVGACVFAASLDFKTVESRYFNATKPSEDPLKYYTKKGPVPRQTYQELQRAGFKGEFDYMAHDKARIMKQRMQKDADEKALREGRSRSNTWQQRGPLNSGGRVTDLAGDPSNAQAFYIGSASGGVFKTIDGGLTLTPIFDQTSAMSVGGLAVDPNDFNTLYVGTGEANPGGGSVSYPGHGIFKTRDGGATWSHLGLETTRYIGRVVVDPRDSNRVFVAAMGELFRESEDRGLYMSDDGGQNWRKTLFVSPRVGAADIAIDPSNPDRIFVAMWERVRVPSSREYGGAGSGVWRSVDGGKTWSKLATGLPTGDQGRIGLAIAPANPDRVFAIYADKTGYFRGLYRSDNGGESFAQLSSSGLEMFYNSFGWWFGRVWVHPTNADQVWVAGVTLHVSNNGGNSFTTRGANTHADHHALWMPPSHAATVILGNDGGLFKSTDNGTSFRELPLPVTQLYAIEANGTGHILGGFQDNGTRRTQNGNALGWEHINGGDGMTPLLDPNSRTTIYAGSQNGAVVRSTNNGSSFGSATSGASGRFNWHTPIVIDPSSAGTGATTLYMGSHRLFRSTNNATSWTAVSGDLTSGDQGQNGVTFGTITAIAVAPSRKETIYAGTDDGHVWVSTDYGRNFRDISAALPDFWVTRVTVDPDEDGTVYATFSGFRWAQASAHIFRSTDFGTTWMNISQGLPPSPVNDVVVHPSQHDHLYVATDTGVYHSIDAGATWESYGIGIPLGLVTTDLKIVPAGEQFTIFVGTYGRGIWSIEMP